MSFQVMEDNSAQKPLPSLSETTGVKREDTEVAG